MVFTNLEKNISDALHNDATLSDLAVLALYRMSISIPCMACVRVPNTNHLDLGPMHQDLKTFIQLLINNPSPVLGPGAADTAAGVFGGGSWSRPKALQLKHRLHNTGLLVNVPTLWAIFLAGALATWEHFTVEFAADSLIASMLPDKQCKWWMPATNNLNKGALGSLHVMF